MKPSNKEIAEKFSGGNFEFTYPYLSEDIKWSHVGDKILFGKENVIEFCKQTTEYFKTVTFKSEMSNIIIDNDIIAIDGTAQFTNNEGKTTHISSCDIYKFSNEKLQEITSYCIVTNKD